MQPLVVNAVLGASFRPKPQIHAFQEAIREALQDSYQPPVVLNIPEQISDFMAPRILIQSLHGFSTIVLSQQAVNLQVQFSPDWQVAPELCLAYARKGAKRLFSVLDAIQTPEPDFFGCSVVAQLPISATLEHTLDLIAQEALSGKVSEGTNELNVRVSRGDGNYFLNSTLQSYRLWSQNNGSMEPMPDVSALQHGIQMDLEVNDRRGFNEQPGYHSNAEVADVIVQRVFDNVKDTGGRLVGKI